MKGLFKGTKGKWRVVKSDHDEYLDDYVCDRDDIEEWKPID